MSLKKNETTRVVRVIYTDPERLDLGRKLAEAHGAMSQIEADFDMVKTSFKSKTAAKEAEIADLSTKVSTGFRLEPVKCLWEMDQPKPMKKQLRRVDTSEVIETEDMTERDKQVDLPLTEMAEKLNEALPAGVTATVTGVAGDGSVTVPADK